MFACFSVVSLVLFRICVRVRSVWTSPKIDSCRDYKLNNYLVCYIEALWWIFHMRSGQKLYFATFCQGDVDQKCYFSYKNNRHPKMYKLFWCRTLSSHNTYLHQIYSFPNRSTKLWNFTPDNRPLLATINCTFRFVLKRDDLYIEPNSYFSDLSDSLNSLNSRYCLSFCISDNVSVLFLY